MQCASLCCDAFRNAVSHYGYQTGLILHSDHGSQYTSQEYRTLLAQHESIRQSMGRTHCCFDNARMESFFATLKKELIYRLHCVSMKREQVRQLIFRWIETYYNRLRRNTANEDNLPPLVKRLRWTQKRSQVAWCSNLGMRFSWLFQNISITISAILSSIHTFSYGTSTCLFSPFVISRMWLWEIFSIFRLLDSFSIFRVGIRYTKPPVPPKSELRHCPCTRWQRTYVIVLTHLRCHEAYDV